MTTKDIARSCMAVALLAISAQITIPMGPIPFTLQVFTLSLLGYTLSRKQIIITITSYILIGLIGLPVFSNFGAGLLMFTKPSFGFIIGFIPFILLVKKNRFIALTALYVIGVTYLVIVMKTVYLTPLAIPVLILNYGLIFIPTDLIAITISRRLTLNLPQRFLTHE